MLMIRFSVGVGSEHAMEVQRTLHDEFGVGIIRTSLYKEDVMETILPNERVYIDCYAPYDSMKLILTWLNIREYNVILTY